MKFKVTFEQDEDGIWIVECPKLPGCVSQGNTREEAIENIKDAIKGCLEVLSEDSMLPPDIDKQALAEGDLFSSVGSDTEQVEVAS
ncbi:MAG: type II toxin-antitoxin system HicB family antitoxin [Planctomycetota bacterium]